MSCLAGGESLDTFKEMIIQTSNLILQILSFDLVT
jgi:hypothetical protein